MKKRIVETLVVVSFLTLLIVSNRNTAIDEKDVAESQTIIDTIEPELYADFSNYTIIAHTTFTDEQEELRNEILYGELEEAVLVVQAEAGNQDELGKRYVADVIFNRLDSEDFPDTVHEVVYQRNPIQFATTVNGSMDVAAYNVTEDVFQIVLEEYINRTNSDIIYFRTEHYSTDGKPAFKHGDHFFSTR